MEAVWNKKEIKAKNYIGNSITNTQLELVISETTKKMIDKLDVIYLVKYAVKLLCKRKLLELRMKQTEKPAEFFNGFEKLVSELKNAGETVSNDDKLNYPTVDASWEYVTYSWYSWCFTRKRQISRVCKIQTNIKILKTWKQ